jgi:RNA polymerase sigma factor (TIGR02999 family)
MEDQQPSPDSPSDDAAKLAAEQELFGRLYSELKDMAARIFNSQKKSHTLQPTALVHEAYLKMIRPEGRGFQDEGHFFATAARAMRQILVNHARDRAAHKRGGNRAGHRVTLSGLEDSGFDDHLEVLAVHEALEDLALLDERQARVAELRVFGGLTNQETATVIGVSLRTVEMEWKMAKIWMSDRLRGR